MRIGPGDSALQSQLQAQLQASASPLESRPGAVRQGVLPLDAPREARPAGERSPRLTPQQTDGRNAQASSSRQLALSSQADLTAAEERVNSLLGREAPVGRISQQNRSQFAQPLGQVLDILV